MGKSKCDIRIGTSGWHYEHWKGVYYPEKLAKSKWLEFYANDFDTVELNNTFYRLANEGTFEKWYSQVPEDFIYSVKASRYITHIKKLTDCVEGPANFFERAKLLKEKLGPILYQLPPSFRKDIDRLKTFVKTMPKAKVSVFEFRNNSWYSDDVFELLNSSGVGFCIHDMAGSETPRMVTGKSIYVRFHGAAGKYAGNYPRSEMKKWAAWIREQMKNVEGIYVYFNNDANAYAVNNAIQLKKLLIK